ncbi:MAG: response regulator, partial [Lachnospiraceae bacterium]|nr:response regulator [Lachnospiraceae bacterium]
PINAILGMDEMILRESNEDEILNYAENIRSASNNLLGIVNDVLDFSKIEAGKMDILPVEYELTSVINDLYNVIKKRAEDKGLKLYLDIDPSVPDILYGDEIRLKQVITNILTNAVKYTETGSVSLSIKNISEEVKGSRTGGTKGHSAYHGEACYKNPVWLKIDVRDTGIGIRAEDKDKLFSAFDRLEEERNRTIEGTGLGLNITTMLLNLMGSSLEVERVYGEGSDFYFVIEQGIIRDEPIGDINDRWKELSGTRKEYKERFTAEKAHILVVDDTVMNLEVFKGLLKKTRIGIDTAESGAETLKLVKKNAYDIIFLDHRMPIMDGVECFKLLKAMDDNMSKSAPVIALTANAISGAREEYLSIGFTDYLTKPIDASKLEDMLLRYLPEEKVNIIPIRTSNNIKSAGNAYRANKATVAIIDDEELIHNAAKNILGREYRIDSYTSGEEGIEGVKKHIPDMILLDLMMPEMDGFSVMEKLRSEDKLRRVPVIFLTGDDNNESEVRGFESGAWDFVRKPFVAEVLKQRVAHTIELSRLQKDLRREVAVWTLRAEHLTEEIMMALSKAVDAKDHYTKGHSERVSGYATIL